MSRTNKGGSVRKILLFLFFVGLFSGCVPRLKQILPPEELLARQTILHQIQKRFEDIRTLSGAARVVIRTPEGRFSAEEVIRLQSPDALRLETWNSIGGLQTLIIVRGGEGVFSIPGESKTVRFSAGRGSLKRFLGVDFSVDELLQLLTGTPPLSGVEAGEVRLEYQEDRTLLRIMHGRRLIQKVWMDSSGRVLRWERFSRKGKLIETILFEDFQEVDGIPIPFQITFTGLNDTGFVLRYRSLFLNRAIEERLFDPPDSKGT
jgi:outer membrane lipoprotein-sorting protein